jgi:hydrogenase maturation protease
MKSVMKTLVIGYGNTLRGDDGVGYWVAEAVEAWNLRDVRSHPCHQLTLDVAAEIAEADQVIFVDATPPGNPCSPLKIERLVPMGETGRVSTHHNTPQGLLAMSQALYGQLPSAYAILLPTRDFQFSECLSPIAESGMRQALMRIRNLVLS